MPRILLVIALLLLVLLGGYYFLAPSDQGAPGPTGQSSPPQGERPQPSVFPLPTQETPEAEKTRYSEFLAGLAQEAEYLQISNCEPSPLVLHLKQGQSFTVRNIDAAPHTLQVGELSFTAPAGSRRASQTDLGHGPGAYAYTCDQSTDPVGIFWVTP